MYSFYFIEEIDVIWENLYYIIWYVNRNNRIVKNILSCFYYWKV